MNRNHHSKTPVKHKSAAFSHASLEDVSKPPASPQKFALRFLLALLGAYYFFFHSTILHHLRRPEGLFQAPYWVGLLATGTFVITTVFLVLWKYVLRRGQSFRHLRLRTRKPIVVLTLSGLVAYFALIVAFWPVFGFSSPVIFTLLSYSVLCGLSFV